MTLYGFSQVSGKTGNYFVVWWNNSALNIIKDNYLYNCMKFKNSKESYIKYVFDESCSLLTIIEGIQIVWKNCS